MSNNPTVSKLSRKSSILRIVGLFLIIVSFITFLVFTSRQGDKIQEQKNIIIKKDSVISEIKDSTKTIMSKQDSLEIIVKKFINLRKAHKADSLEELYSDVVINYFKNLHHVHKRAITESDREYWNHFPNERFFVTDSVQIMLDTTPNKALVRGKECRSEIKCLEEIIEIHFDKGKKINYVRAFYSN